MPLLAWSSKSQLYISWCWSQPPASSHLAMLTSPDSHQSRMFLPILTCLLSLTPISSVLSAGWMSCGEFWDTRDWLCNCVPAVYNSWWWYYDMLSSDELHHFISLSLYNKTSLSVSCDRSSRTWIIPMVREGLDKWIILLWHIFCLLIIITALQWQVFAPR